MAQPIEKTPLVSIGLPVFNGTAYLEQAIESVLCQSFNNFELIVSDNASTDDTREIVERFQKNDTRIRLHRQTENVGAISNWVSALQLGRGRYFVFVAHDDIWDTDFLAETLRILEENKHLTSAFSKVQIIDENGSPTKTLDMGFLESRLPRSTYAAAKSYARSGKDYHAYAIHRRSHLLDCLPYLTDQSRHMRENSIWAAGTFTHSLVLTGAFGVSPKPLFNYRVHPASLSRDSADGVAALKGYAYYTKHCLSLYLKCGCKRFGIFRGGTLCYRIIKIHGRVLFRMIRRLRK
jgi:glycosyltransferase involved in cell wall biosynthesis